MTDKSEVIARNIPIVKHDELGTGFIDLTNATQDALEQLANDVAIVNGEIGVLVHPFTSQEDDPYPLTPAYEATVVEFIAQTQEALRPLIIFEEMSRVDKLAETFSSTNPIYIVQTLDTDPVPACAFFFQEPFIHRYPYREERNMVMMALMREMKAAGVTQAEVGGRYLVNTSATDSQKGFNLFATYTQGMQGAMPWVENGVYPAGCVGTAIHGFLRSGVEVALAPASPANDYSPTP